MADSLSHRLRRLACGDDPRQSLRDLLIALRDAGFEPVNGGVCAAPVAGNHGFSVAHRGQTLQLRRSPGGAAGATTLAPPDRDEVQALLHLAFMRAVEHEEFQRTHERMELLSAASFEGITIHEKGVVVDANHRLAEITGYPLTEIVGTDTLLRLCVAPEDIAQVQKRIAERYEGAYVISAIRKDGSRFRAEFQSKQGRLGDRPVRVAAVRDVSEREKTLAVLRESEMRLRDLADQTFDFTVISRDGVVIDVRGRVHELFGYRPQDIIGRRTLDLIAPKKQPVPPQAISEQRPGHYETTVIAADGEPIPVDIVEIPSTMEGVPVRMVGGRDLREIRRRESEQRRLQQLTERGQRLESLGVLAGGIAHDFNNLLVGVLGNADLLMRRMPDAENRQVAAAIRTAGERAASLTKQMLAYAGQGELIPRQPVDLGELWTELATLLEASLSKMAVLNMDIEPSCIALGDRATIMQVFMNLLTNASDALEGRPGTIEVRTRHVRTPGPEWRHAMGVAVRPGDWLQIDVTDDGVGMDEGTAARVFEPFFSTKSTGHGLGLAACLGIVSSHGGAIRLESAPGKGSCFSILLPATMPAAAVSAAAPKASVVAAARVLVVDDEPLVRSLAHRALAQAGYVVEEAADGASAMVKLQESGADVMLLDMTMPDMDGAEVVRRVRKAGYPVAIVLSSGYMNAAVERGLDPALFQGFLSKPYRLEDLMDSIRRALARPPSGSSSPAEE